MSAQPVYNKVTKKFEFPKPEPGQSTVPNDQTYVAIPKSTIAILAGFAKADGADMNAETAKGKLAKATSYAKLYVLQAVDEFIASRQPAK